MSNTLPSRLVIGVSVNRMRDSKVVSTELLARKIGGVQHTRCFDINSNQLKSTYHSYIRRNKATLVT